MTGYGYPADAARLFYGENARHVPGFLWVQDQGQGTVAFVGSSMTPGRDNPLRYGAGHWDRDRDRDRDGYYAHHLIVGELIVRPHVVIATHAADGHGLGGLLTGGPDMEEALTGGRLLIGDSARLAEIVHRSRTGAWRDR